MKKEEISMNKVTQPLRSKKKVDELLTYLKGKNYRDYMIAKIQLNTARRIGDIINLKVLDILNEDFSLKKYITIQEQKTKKIARIVINQSIQESIKDYIFEKKMKYNDYLFKSRKGENKPITKTQAHRIFQDAAKVLGLENFGTHSLRKTWGYFCYQETHNIALIMDVYNHSSEKITLRYIGITQKDKDYMHMLIKF